MKKITFISLEEIEMLSFSKSFLNSLLLFLILIVGGGAFYFGFLVKFFFIIQLVAVLLLILFYRKNNIVLVFLFFSISYLYLPKYFMIDEIPISYWNYYQDAGLLNLLVFLNVLFFLGFSLGLRRVFEADIYQQIIIGRLRNGYAFYFLVIILLLIFKYGLRGEVVIISGGYGGGDVSKSSLHEYFIPIYFVAILFLNPKSYFQKYVLYFLAFFYSFKTLLYGGRIEIVQIMLLLLFVFLNFFKGRVYLLYLLFLFGMIFINLIGEIRSDPTVLLEPMRLLVIESDVPEKISSQYGDVNQSSLRILGLINDGYISIEQRIFSFFTVIFGFLAPSSLMPDFYNLATFRRDVAYSGGGGLISAYSYAWLSFLGPVVFGFFVGSAYRFLYKSKNIYLVSYGLMVAVMFPRWFAYYPVALFKICFISLVVIFFYMVFRRFFIRNFPKTV